MDFFDSIPRPEPPERPKRLKRPTWMRPENIVPITVPFDRILLHTPEVGVFITALRAYPSGFELTVSVRRPRSAERGGHRDRPNNPFGRHRLDPDGQDDEAAARALRFGVLFADGRRAAADGRRPLPIERSGTPPEVPTMSQQGGHGSDHDWEQTFWVWGLPEEGPVTIVYSWAAQNVPETSLEIDGDQLRSAAGRAVLLWPEPEDE